MIRIGHPSKNILLVLLTLASWETTTAVMQTSYDSRTKHASCLAFAPVRQTNCNACCPSALAAAVAARDCLSTYGKQNKAYSIQHLWNCAARDTSSTNSNAQFTCANGINVPKFFDTLYALFNNTGVLLPATPVVGNTSITPANATACSPDNTAAYGLDSLRVMNAEAHSTQDSSLAMQEEILMHGPVVSVITATASDWQTFSNWSLQSAQTTMVPLNHADTNDPNAKRHCVSVVGWGVSASGVPYWLVQNSFGTAWGDKGFARMLRGNRAWGLEDTWYAASSIHSAQSLVDLMFVPTDLVNTEQQQPTGQIVIATVLVVAGLAALLMVAWRRPSPNPNYPYREVMLQ